MHAGEPNVKGEKDLPTEGCRWRTVTPASLRVDTQRAVDGGLEVITPASLDTCLRPSRERAECSLHEEGHSIGWHFRHDGKKLHQQMKLDDDKQH